MLLPTILWDWAVRKKPLRLYCSVCWTGLVIYHAVTPGSNFSKLIIKTCKFSWEYQYKHVSLNLLSIFNGVSPGRQLKSGSHQLMIWKFEYQNVVARCLVLLTFTCTTSKSAWHLSIEEANHEIPVKNQDKPLKIITCSVWRLEARLFHACVVGCKFF